MPGGGLHVQDGFLDVTQDVQVLLKLVLDLQQAPGNLRTLLAAEMRHLCLGAFFLPSKVKLGLTHLWVEREHGVKCLQALPADDLFSSDAKHTPLRVTVVSTCMHAHVHPLYSICDHLKRIINSYWDLQQSKIAV